MTYRPESAVSSTPNVSKPAWGLDRLGRAFYEARLPEVCAYVLPGGVRLRVQRHPGCPCMPATA